MNNQKNTITESLPFNMVANSNGFKIAGALVYSNASSIIQQSMLAVKNHFKTSDSNINFDCAEVTRIDSAGIALLIEWKRMCDQNNRQFSISNLPDQAKSLIETYRLKDVF